jgi:hypothetical protein
MAFNLIPCPPFKVGLKNKNPKAFVEYCESFIKTNNPGMKAVGIKTIEGGTIMIMCMPDYEAKRCIVKGTGKNKVRTYEPLYKVPVERFLSADDLEYLKSKGRDKYGDKIK